MNATILPGIVASLSSVKWNTIYRNCWKQKRAAEADERHVMQWKRTKLSRNLIFIYHFFSSPRMFLLCCFWLWGNGGGGGRGQLNDFAKQQQATTAGREHRRLTRTDPRLAGSIFCMPVLLSNLPTPRLICARERISFHNLMNIHEGRVLDAQAAEKTRRPMSERCCSEDSPPPLVPLLLSTVFPSLSEIHLFSCEL